VWLRFVLVTHCVLAQHHGMGPDLGWSVSELEQHKVKDDSQLACLIATAMTASNDIDCDHK
jgi:hypothetical protein